MTMTIRSRAARVVVWWAVVTQTMVELVAMVVLVRLVPRLVPPERQPIPPV